MESLWFAIAIYSMGLAGVIWLRPALMFNENGTWKEFGYQRGSRYTLFPVWLFAIEWAFVSYALAAALIWILTGRSLAVAASAAATASAVRWTPSRGISNDDESDEESDEEFTIPVSRVSRGSGSGSGSNSGSNNGNRSNSGSSKKPRAGYYMLDTESEQSGLRRYIYYGNKPPQDE